MKIPIPMAVAVCCGILPLTDTAACWYLTALGDKPCGPQLKSSKVSSDPHKDPIIPNRITGYLEQQRILCTSEEAKDNILRMSQLVLHEQTYERAYGSCTHGSLI